MLKYLWITLCIFVVCVHSFVYIGTGRGIIKAVQSGNSYTLQEVTQFWDYVSANDTSIQWYREFNEFNGVMGNFLRSVLFPDRVWDCQGAKYTAGTPVVLHPKKNTIADTKNQRWNWGHPAEMFEIIQNPKMVANVTSAGKVVLAVGTRSPFQKFHPLDPDFVNDRFPITFHNTIGDTVVTVQSPVGDYVVTVPGNSTTPIKFFDGSIISIVGAVPPFTYPASYARNFSIPPEPRLPMTYEMWNGTIGHTNGSNTTLRLNLTISYSDQVLGAGTDGMFGSIYDVYGVLRNGFMNLSLYYRAIPTIVANATITYDGKFHITGTTKVGSQQGYIAIQMD